MYITENIIIYMLKSDARHFFSAASVGSSYSYSVDGGSLVRWLNFIGKLVSEHDLRQIYKGGK